MPNIPCPMVECDTLCDVWSDIDLVVALNVLLGEIRAWSCIMKRCFDLHRICMLDVKMSIVNKYRSCEWRVRDELIPAYGEPG